MQTNTDITVYNKYYNSDTDAEEFYRVVVRNVMWEDRKAANKLASGGDLAADIVTVFIPIIRGADHVEPKAWAALSAVNKALKWTLKEDDILVKGIVPAAVDVDDLEATYENIVDISSADKMDQGSRRMQHWRVGGK